MNVQTLLHGFHKMPWGEEAREFGVAAAGQLLFAAGSVRWNLDRPQSGPDPTPPDELSLRLIFDGTWDEKTGWSGGTERVIHLKQCLEGFHAALVPAMFPLALDPAARHRLALQFGGIDDAEIDQSGDFAFHCSLLEYDAQPSRPGSGDRSMMIVRQIFNDISNYMPLRTTFDVERARQALFVAGSTIVESGDKPVSVEVVVDDGRPLQIQLGKPQPGFHVALVPAIFPLQLSAGPHRLELRNADPARQGKGCFFSATLLDFD